MHYFFGWSIWKAGFNADIGLSRLPETVSGIIIFGWSICRVY
jgi:hypothetical protein